MFNRVEYRVRFLTACDRTDTLHSSVTCSRLAAERKLATAVEHWGDRYEFWLERRTVSDWKPADRVRLGLHLEAGGEWRRFGRVVLPDGLHIWLGGRGVHLWWCPPAITFDRLGEES